jgi:L-threonylcarbamoyladenylate synthase
VQDTLDRLPPESRIGVLAIERGLQLAGAHRRLLLPDDPAGYARVLYASLHALDDDRCTLIVVERPPATPPWAAIHDRLLRSTR